MCLQLVLEWCFFLVKNLIKPLANYFSVVRTCTYIYMYIYIHIETASEYQLRATHLRMCTCAHIVCLKW